MSKYSKWSSAPETYKEMTYKKANELYLKSEKKKKDKKNIKYINRYIDEEEEIIVEQVYTDKYENLIDSFLSSQTMKDYSQHSSHNSN